jgi:hypothetical protein
MDPENEWYDEAKFLAELRGEFEPTYEILIGLAYGRALEKPDKYRVQVPHEGYEVPVKVGPDWRRFFIPERTVRPGLNVLDRNGVFEVRTEKVYNGVTVVMKADHVIGRIVSDNKTTFKTFDFDKYAHSYQWRFYLDAFGAQQFTYNVFRLYDERGDIEIAGVEQFNLFPYSEMERDCAALVGEFCDYVRARNLEPLLAEREQKALQFARTL